MTLWLGDVGQRGWLATAATILNVLTFAVNELRWHARTTGAARQDGNCRAAPRSASPDGDIRRAWLYAVLTYHGYRCNRRRLPLPFIPPQFRLTSPIVIRAWIFVVATKRARAGGRHRAPLRLPLPCPHSPALDNASRACMRLDLRILGSVYYSALPARAACYREHSLHIAVTSLPYHSLDISS